MGTRSGAIDGMGVLRLAEMYGADQASHMLNKDSGLKGLGGSNDMRLLLAADTPEANFAVEHFCYWAARHAGSALVALGGFCLLYTSPSPRDQRGSRMPSSA